MQRYRDAQLQREDRIRQELHFHKVAHLDVAGAPPGASERRDRLGGAAGILQHVDDGRQVALVGRGQVGEDEGRHED